MEFRVSDFSLAPISRAERQSNDDRETRQHHKPSVFHFAISILQIFAHAFLPFSLAAKSSLPTVLSSLFVAHILAAIATRT